jgi:hypothetical protein
MFHDRISSYDDKAEKLSIDIPNYAMTIEHSPKNLKKLTPRKGKSDIQCQYPISLSKLKTHIVNEIKYPYDLPEGLKKLEIYGHCKDELGFIRSINEIALNYIFHLRS